MNKPEIYCNGCGYKIKMMGVAANLICPNCDGLNKVNLQTKQVIFIPKKMRNRTTSSGLTFR